MPGTPTHSKSTTGLLGASCATRASGPWLARIDHRVRAHARRLRAPRGREVRGDDRLDPAPREGGDHREPDRPTAHHHGRLAGPQARFRDGVLRHGEGLGERCGGGGQRIGNAQQPGLAQHHALAVAARELVRVADPRDAVADRHHRHRADAVAARELALAAGPEVENLGAELVAHHDVAGEVHHEREGVDLPGDARHGLAVLQRVEIRPADAAGQRLHQHLARPRHRLLHLGVDDSPAPHDGCAHPGSFPFGPRVPRRCRPQPYPGRGRAATFRGS